MNWNNVVRWLQEVDGSCIIHKSLTVRSTTTTSRDRGLFASDTIHGGDTLIRIPLTASINGKLMPCTYEYTTKGEAGTSSASVRNASPWLRCLAALIKELRLRGDGQHPQSSHYLDSLPQDYETLWKWSNREIEEYLAGTRSPDYNDAAHDDPSTVKAATTAAASNPWTILTDPNVIRQQYELMVRPYLVHCGILDATATIISSSDANEKPDESREEQEYKLFQRACQIMSTRSFCNMSVSDSDESQRDESQHNDTNNSNADITKYDGPYLLPIIDLINHVDTCTGLTNTKLEFTAQPNSAVSSYYFIMRALCTITPDTEILHSYGDELSNYQFLSSFGFIPINRMTWAQHHHDQQPMQTVVTNERTTPTSLTTTTPQYTKSVVVTKQEIWEACWDIIESGFPERLAASMIESTAFDPDETWTVTTDKNRTGDCVPDSIVIIQPLPLQADQQSTSTCSGHIENNESTIDRNSILCDELVTAACIPFLPKCAYAEITSRTLLDASLLQDYYLGQLVGTALLQMIQRRLLLYRPIPASTIQRLRQSDDLMNDKEILHSFLRCMEATNDSCDICGNRTNDVLPGGADLNVEQRRLAYGLTIRLEEKEILNSLANTILLLLNSLNRNVENETGTKKFKTSESY